jgi:hypothetical protein
MSAFQQSREDSELTVELITRRGLGFLRKDLKKVMP